MSKSKAPKPQPTIEPAIVKDAYDQILYDGVRENAGNLQDLVKNDPDRDILTSDIFSALYKSKPTLRSESRGLSRKLMETMMGLPEYQTLRAHTKFDDITSALGTIKLAPRVLESYEEARKKMEQKQQEQKGQNPGPDGNDPENQIDDDIMDGLRQGIRSGLKAAQESSEEWGDVAKGWGVGRDELGSVPTEAKFVLAEKLLKSSKLRKIADMAGRLIQVANAAAAQTPVRGMDEVTDVITGSDLSDILPSEWLKLKMTPALFMKDLMEDNLMMYNLRGVENQGYGPIIMCLDISPSMQGEREVFAKALAIALMFMAEKQKRAFGLVTFGTQVHETMYVPAGQKSSIENKMQIAEIVCNGGGTDFYVPLKAAFVIRQQEKAQLNPADIVFLTDGECEMDEEQHEEIAELKKETSVRIQGIAICDGSSDEVCEGSTLERFSDNLATVDKLGEVHMVKGILANAAAGKR
jgi:hypothetical protein